MKDLKSNKFRSRSPTTTTTALKEAGSSSIGPDIGLTGTSGVTIGVIGVDDGTDGLSNCSKPETPKQKKRGR